MKDKQRKCINWEKTGKKLQLLRIDNINLRRFCCKQLKFDKGNCSGNCDLCVFEMDHSISRAELARVFNVSENMIVNWENGKSRPTMEDILFYADICEIELFDVLIFDN